MLNALLNALGAFDHVGLDSVVNARTQPSCPFRCTQLDEDTEPEFFGTSLVRRENLMKNVAHLETNFKARAVDVGTTAVKVNLCTTGYLAKENDLLKIHGTAKAPCRVETKWKHSSRWLPPIYHASLRAPIDAQWPGRKQLVECRCEDNRCPFGHCTCNQRYLQWYLLQLLEVELNWIQVFYCFDLLDRQENPQSLPCASSKLNEFSKPYLKWMFFGSRHPLTATPPEGSTIFPVQDINFAPRQFQTVKFIHGMSRIKLNN